MKVLPITNTPGRHLFECPGCKCSHMINTAPGNNWPVWGYNGNGESPTVTPSILVQTPHKDGVHVCHSFVTDGKIQFLNDCTHELAGQTVELPDLD